MRWIEDFLTDRSFVVKVNDAISDPKSVLSGVPQGSVLGPLLFIIFINDLPTQCLNESVYLKMFADDVKLYTTFQNSQQTDILVDSLIKIEDWSTLWGMQIAPNKSQTLHLGNKNPKRQYTIANTQIPEETCIRDL